MKVKATNQYEILKLKDKELQRIPKEGEIFDVSEERYEVLTKNNDFNVKFVEAVKQEKEIKTTIKQTNKIKKNWKDIIKN